MIQNREHEAENQQGEQNQDNGEKKGHSSEHDHGNSYVIILINEKTYQVHQGRLEVSKIRELDDIPITDVIYQVPEYLLLATDGFIVVHGGEMFKSGAPSGQSS